MGASLPLALFGVVKGWQHTEQLGQCPNRRHGLRPRRFVSLSVTAPLGGTGCVTTAQLVVLVDQSGKFKRLNLNLDVLSCSTL
jgi:hypothetical protein